MITATEASTQSRFLEDRRDLRARRFANELLHFLQEYIAERSRHEAWEKLYEMAHQNNLEMVALPPELDGLKWLELQMAKYATNAPILEPQSQNSTPHTTT